MNTLLDTHQIKLTPYNPQCLANLCGQCNEHLKLIEKRFPVKIFNRGNLFEVKGDAAAVNHVSQLLEDLFKEAMQNDFLSPQCVHLKIREFRMQQNRGQLMQEDSNTRTGSRQLQKKINAKKKIIAANQGMQHEGIAPISELMIDSSDGAPFSILTPQKEIKLRGDSQKKYIANVKLNDINFGIGPAGTGKTYLAVACAVQALEQDLVQKILLVRPAVEAGEKLGFLPGDLSEKVNPYLRPLYDALYEMIGAEKVEKLIERQLIEIAPLAYMRGRTLSNAFIILDESQNTTKAQMKMFLTRIGFGSKVVITGDYTQIDLPRGIDSGLVHAMTVLKNVKGIGFSRFTAKDVVRHSLVQAIIEAYDQEENI